MRRFGLHLPDSLPEPARQQRLQGTAYQQNLQGPACQLRLQNLGRLRSAVPRGRPRLSAHFESSQLARRSQAPRYQLPRSRAEPDSLAQRRSEAGPYLANLPRWQAGQLSHFPAVPGRRPARRSLRWIRYSVLANPLQSELAFRRLIDSPGDGWGYLHVSPAGPPTGLPRMALCPCLCRGPGVLPPEGGRPARRRLIGTCRNLCFSAR